MLPAAARIDGAGSFVGPVLSFAYGSKPWATQERRFRSHYVALGGKYCEDDGGASNASERVNVKWDAWQSALRSI